MTDQELTAKIKEGDEQAFEKLVCQYQSLVVNTCYGFIHQYEDAEDVAQEVFVDVYRKIDQFRGESKLSTWLYRIAVNHSISFLRSKKRTEYEYCIGASENSDHVMAMQIKDYESALPDKKIEAKETKKILYEAINKLPENQKKAFVLNKFRELSYKEISEIMKISLSAVESLIFRANQNLQKRLIKFYKKN